MELRELLEIGPGLTALIGGGGKTTLMYHLASELRQQGQEYGTIPYHDHQTVGLKKGG